MTRVPGPDLKHKNRTPIFFSGRFSRAVLDYNETRASDVFVVNFGAHYPATPEGDEEFKEDIFPLLDDMAVVGETATVIWRQDAKKESWIYRGWC